MSASSRVAVIDDGVDATHPDLDANVLNSGSACHRVPNGGHGTHVAGIIAAERNNDGAVVGVAPNARILPIKIHFPTDFLREDNGDKALDPDCHEEVPSLAAAIIRAIKSGVHVINMSLSSGPEPDEEGQDTVELAIRAAAMENIVVVTGGGNCGHEDQVLLDRNNCESRHQRQRPAVYPSVIAVASTGEDRIRAPGSTSNRDVDIAAPGGVMLSTWPEAAMLREGEHCDGADSVGRTCWMAGTSMAAPVVSGVVAHMKAHYPEASVAEIQYALYSTADRTNDSGNPNYSNDYGHGFINPVGAIGALEDLNRRLGEFVAVSSGYVHTCGLGTNGAVECWGSDTDGKTNRPIGIFTKISAGYFHTCGIREADRARWSVGATTAKARRTHHRRLPLSGERPSCPSSPRSRPVGITPAAYVTTVPLSAGAVTTKIKAQYPAGTSHRFPRACGTLVGCWDPPIVTVDHGAAMAS